jgi:hypothetical protein
VVEIYLFQNLFSFWEDVATKGFRMYETPGSYFRCLDEPKMPDLVAQLEEIFNKSEF